MLEDFLRILRDLLLLIYRYVGCWAIVEKPRWLILVFLAVGLIGKGDRGDLSDGAKGVAGDLSDKDSTGRVIAGALTFNDNFGFVREAIILKAAQLRWVVDLVSQGSKPGTIWRSEGESRRACFLDIW